MDALKYKVHPWGVLFHLCKLKMWGCEELNPLNPSKERQILMMEAQCSVGGVCVAHVYVMHSIHLIGWFVR